MERMSASRVTLSLESWIMGAAVLAILFVAWAWLLRMGAEGAVFICRAPTAVPAIGMWTVMMIAMMTPSALPMMLTFAEVTTRHARSADRLPLIALFVAVYLAVWGAFGAAAGAGEWLLAQRGLIQEGSAIAPRYAAALLVVAGLYQWSAVKSVCLANCQAPLLFLSGRYRTGYGGALKLGLEHAFACIGCCWALMLLALVGGSMNLAWMVVLTLLVSIEKLLGSRPAVLRLSALVLLGAGAGLLLAPA